MADDPTSLSSILILSIFKISKLCNKKNKIILDLCELYSHELKNNTSNNPPLQGISKSKIPQTADHYFLLFKLCCESKQPKLMELSLDTCQKLISYGYLKGDIAIDRTQYPLDIASRESFEPSTPIDNNINNENNKHNNRKLIDIIVETIYECSSFQDDNVQLQVIKVLLTLVTSSSCSVHEHSLMLAVRACYHIHLSSSNLVNRTTARASLTQMLNVCFQNMENATTEYEIQEERAAKEAKDKSISSPKSIIIVDEHKLIESSEPTLDTDHKEIVEKEIDTLIDPINLPNHPDNIKLPLDDDKTDIKEVIVATASSPTPDISPPPPPEKIAPNPLGKFGWCVVCRKTANHYCLQTKVPVCSVICKQTHLTTVSSHPAPPASVLQSIALKLQNDAYLVFRALCKLSLKNLPPSDNDDYNIALRSKVLSLELLLSILENCGFTFRTARKFIEAVKENLAMSLLESCVSPIEQIFSLSLSIFVSLLRHFKPHLKTEIGVFLDHVFLRIVENPNSTFGHKMMILQVFSKLSQDPQSLVDLFLNFDCDSTTSVPIYQHLITVLEKISQGRLVSENWITPAQEITLKMLALESLVSSIKSLVAWTEKAQWQIEEAGKVKELGIGNDAISEVDLETVVDVNSFDDSIEPNNAPNYTKQTIATNFEKIRQKQKATEIGVREFNIKPKNGYKYLLKSGVINETPESFAEFLHSGPGLDKAAIGEYLGEFDPFNIKVLHCFVDCLDFTGLNFEQGLRTFLESFRLPGEAQKIDRLLEKFAARFCQNNPTVFHSADVAYVLAYSVIMLNTDLHNPMVKNRMTKEEFLRNNRGINGKDDLPSEYMSTIYDNISDNEIKMKDTAEALSTPQLNPKLRQLTFIRDSQALVKKTQQLMSGSVTTPQFENFTFAASDDLSPITPMFNVIWGPALGTFSVLLQQLDEARVVALCLDGYRFAIRLAGLFQMNIELDAFVKSLAQFTLLGTAKEMKQKNIDAIKVLLTIAYSEGDRLMSCWNTVLNCISEFERLHLIGVGAPSDSAFFNVAKIKNAATNPVIDAAILERKEQQAGNAQNVLKQIEPSLLDRIFSHSSQLSSEAIVFFVDNLCQISKREMTGPEPRIFSLQKIVEVTYHNMGRVRYVWSAMWSILSIHFAHAGVHSNSKVSMYAIDSLKQLSTKFLEKEELANYNFQKLFLNPFETIMQTAASGDIREFIIQCFRQMIFARVDNVKSGWTSVFAVCRVAAKDRHEPVVASSFDLISKLIKDHFNLLTDALPELVDCLAQYGQNIFTDIALHSINHLIRCAQYLGELPSSLNDVDNNYHVGDSSAELTVWLCTLRALAMMVSDKRLEVRSTALQSLFKVLRSYGHMFTPSVWQIVFKSILFPIFDDEIQFEHRTSSVHANQDQGLVLPATNSSTFAINDTNKYSVNPPVPIGKRHSSSIQSPVQLKGPSSISDASWLKTTCHSALSSLTDLFSRFFKTVRFLLEDLLQLYSNCVNQESDELARIGCKCLSLAVNVLGPMLNPDEWNYTISSIAKVLDVTLPNDICSNEVLSLLNVSPLPTACDLNTFKIIVSEVPILNKQISISSSTSVQVVNESLSRSISDEKSLNSIMLPFSMKSVFTQCNVQHLLFEVLAELVQQFFTLLSENNIMTILNAIKASILFARSFNSHVELRRRLHVCAFHQYQKSWPDLFYQEAHGLGIYSAIIYRMYLPTLLTENTSVPNFTDTYNDIEDSFSFPHPLINTISLAEKHLPQLCSQLFSEYCEKDKLNKGINNSPVGSYEDELRCKEGVIRSHLINIKKFSSSQLKRNLPILFPLFMDLIECSSSSIRADLKLLLADRLPKLLGI